MTPGFTGAQAATLCNDAALRAALEATTNLALSSAEQPGTRNERPGRAEPSAVTKVSLQHFSDAIDRMVGGLERPTHFMARADLLRTAVHEAGHALAAWRSTHAAAPIKVSVVPRGNVGGFAQTQDLEKAHLSEAELTDHLVVFLAGRVAEELVLGDPSTGASNDLERATNIAYEMVSRLGYSKKVGLLSLGSSDAQRREQGHALRPQVSDATAQLVDSEVRALVARAYATCRRLLQQHQAELVGFADELAAKEVLLAADIQRLLGDRPLAAQQAAALYARPGGQPTRKAGGATTAAATKPAPSRSWAAVFTPFSA
jgi:cell division protease FtsH